MATLVESFLRNVLRSGLLTRDELVGLLRNVPREVRDEPGAVADYLVSAGRLTPFQRQKLLQGQIAGLVLGPFQLEAPLGKGGMGMVYLAQDSRTRRHVALKILSPRKARTEERYLTRFQREIELSRRLVHPNIALTLESGEQRGIHYIVMEYIPGRTLYHVVTKEGMLAVPRAAHLFAEVAGALAHAHGLGLVHRDLKPSNIMVTPHDHAKVLDLGLAFMIGEEVQDVELTGGKGYIVGSVDYMAPEQTVDASSVDARADLYALGCCLYFSLTGRPPFPAGNTKDKVHAHRRAEPTLLQNRNAEVPGAFAQLVHRLLAKDPAGRFQTAAEVEAALRSWAPVRSSAPVETQGDVGFEEAVRHAVIDWPAEVGSANVPDPLLGRSREGDSSYSEPILNFDYTAGDSGRRLGWVAVAIGGFLALVLLLMGLLSLAH